MKTNWFCAPLVKRIHKQYWRDQCNERLQNVKFLFIHLLITMAILIIFRCPNYLYNIWKGPFPMNLNQFRIHLERNYHSLGYKALFSLHSFLFRPEYLQVELGIDAIESNFTGPSEFSWKQHLQGIEGQLFDRVIEPSIDTVNMTLYVKFPGPGHLFSAQQYPYHFEMFSSKTLSCIAQEIVILKKESSNWHEETTYIKEIEEFYKQHTKIFNEKVIRKCGILLGDLYEPVIEVLYKADENSNYRFDENARVFDISQDYITYLPFILLSLLIPPFLYHLYHCSKKIISLVHTRSKSLDKCIKEELMKLDYISLEDFDNQLLKTVSESNYHANLFIINNQYVIIFLIDFNEKSPQSLRRFYSTSPFIILNMNRIVGVESHWLVIEDHGRNRIIHFPDCRTDNNFDRAEWLHRRLLAASTRYEYTYA